MPKPTTNQCAVCRHSREDHHAEYGYCVANGNCKACCPRFVGSLDSENIKEVGKRHNRQDTAESDKEHHGQ